MSTVIMLTRLTRGALASPSSLEMLEREVMERIHAECEDVEWPASYVVLGPYDYLDMFQAPDIETATKVATIVCTFGHAQTEVWAATDWDRFKEIFATCRLHSRRARKPSAPQKATLSAADHWDADS